MERQEGYYWVKYNNQLFIAYWGLKYGAMVWTIVFGNGWPFSDSDFEHINETRIKEPGELPD